MSGCRASGEALSALSPQLEKKKKVAILIEEDSCIESYLVSLRLTSKPDCPVGWVSSKSSEESETQEPTTHPACVATGRANCEGDLHGWCGLDEVTVHLPSAPRWVILGCQIHAVWGSIRVLVGGGRLECPFIRSSLFFHVYISLGTLPVGYYSISQGKTPWEGRLEKMSESASCLAIYL